MSTDTVTIACKVPNGLLLRLFKMTPQTEATPTGFREIEIARQVGEIVRINGPAAPEGQMPLAQMAGGYALTHGVSAEFWEEWLNQNYQSDVVKNKLIFAQPTAAEARAQARDHRTVQSGQERLDMNMVQRGTKQVAADPRVPRSTNPNLRELERYDGKEEAE